MKQVLSLAEKLISIQSTENNHKALEEILEVCKQELIGFKFKEFKKDNIKSLLFFNTPSQPKKFKLILNAHLDVVEGKADQYKPTQKNNRLYGRGAYDMKTAAAAMIIVFKELANKVKYPLGLQLVVDEEVGGFKGTKYQVEQGVRTDFVIAGENTDLKINHKSKGIIWLKVTTTGKSAHGAYPWLGENAIWKMHKALNIIEKLYPVPTEEVWYTTSNVSAIDTPNRTYNKVPDECIVYLDIRYIPEDKKTIVKHITKSLGKDFEIETIVSEPDHFTSESNKYIQVLGEAIKTVTGKNAELVKKHGGSDVRHFSFVGCDGITFGPIGDGHHSDNEWVNIKSVRDYHNILHKFLISF